MLNIFSILIISILFSISNKVYSNQLQINELRNKYAKCDDNNYKHNCFLDYIRDRTRSVGFWKSNSLWEGFYFEDNTLIYSFKNGKAKSMGTCKEKLGWFYCPGGRKYKLLDKNKYKIVFGNGTSYEGMLKDNVKNGFGIVKYKNGSVYRGYWKDDKKNGLGIFTWENGDYYEGEYVDGLRHGQGKYTYNNGKNVLEGIWSEGDFKYAKKPTSTSNTKIEGYKRFCSEIGFIVGTEKFGECVVEVMKKDN
jgi:hypothetical protein